MAHDTTPNLAEVQLVRGVFLDCVIQTDTSSGLDFQQIAGFADPAITMPSFFNLERNEVFFNLEVHTQALDQAGQLLPAFGMFKLQFAFQVEQLSQYLFVHPEHPTAKAMPNLPLTGSLMSVAYSTARGMILAKVADTALSGFALPLRQVQRLMADTMQHQAATEQQAAAPKPPKAKRAKRPA